jgi:hypothetical protein
MGTGTIALPISGLVNVMVNIAAAAAQAQNTTSLLVLTNNSVIDMKTRLLKYSSLADVATAFGSASIEAAVAALWFGQIPTAVEIEIGKWAMTATAALLVGAPLTTAQQAIGEWTKITAGHFKIAINGQPAVQIGPLTFASAANLNAVAADITAGLVTAGAGASCTWDGSKFTFTSTVLGSTATIALLVPTAGDASDIAVQLGCTASNVGSYVVAGSDPETAEDALALFDLLFGYQWYAAMIPQASDADQFNCFQSVQGMSTKHFFGATTQDPNVLDPTATTDLPYLLSQADITKGAVQYSSSSPYAIASLLARILTTDYTQNNSVITLMYKQEPGVTAEYLNRQELSAVLEKNCNVFVAYQGGALIIQPGTTPTTNQFIDTIVGLDNLAIDVQLAIFNLLYTSTTKIPQTDAGMNQIVGAAEGILLQYVADGLLAPGTWTASGFGKLGPGTYLEKGYYIYCPPLSQQAQADRAARMAGPIQIAVKLAGAIHTVDATITVNP